MKRGKHPPEHPWERAAHARRVLLLALIAATTLVASAYMASILPFRGGTLLEASLVGFFALLFAWISIGFWTSLLGFILLLRGRDRFDLPRDAPGDTPWTPSSPLTAIVMPIYNEHVDRVFQSLEATYRSLEATGRLEGFHFFILSDSTDPDTWVQEEIAWARLCERRKAFNRIFYRHRRPNIKRKSGNIADFCRRWGRAYRYLIVLDADSVMAGDTLVNMVATMERNPTVGILQTAPRAKGLENLIARAQQFASHVHGSMFAAGLHFWQLGDAQYWGHNAIVRAEPFMRHCGLPRLSGRPPLGGDILSHDFVEAALMRRAGWGVWLAYDMTGSYEEPPPTLIDELVRDRRWCQGNIQHLRLLFTRGIFPAHRALFLNGAMSYVSALLWSLFLGLSTAKAIVQAVSTPEYFPQEGSLFPTWPVWDLGWAVTLLSSTLVILFLPKLFSLFLVVVRQRRTRAFGGFRKLLQGLAGEVLLSTLLAPVRMLAHSQFVLAILVGRKVAWDPPPREEYRTTWRQALRFHGGGTLLALAWGAAVYVFNRSFFWWLTPILVPLVLAVPLSVWTSDIGLGRRLRRWGFFLTPAEIDPPPELQGRLHMAPHASPTDVSELGIPGRQGFVCAAADPRISSLHIALQRGGRRVAPAIAARRRQLVQKALELGPDHLSRREKTELLGDAESLSALHRMIWELPEGSLSRRWGISAGAT
jgi:membrane glycosyltransferase